MAKKAKLDLSGDGLKKMAVRHCEKAVFATCAVLLLLFVYFGFSREVFDDSKVSPKKLIDSATRSENNIASTKWDEDTDSDEEPSFKTYRVPNLGIPKKVERLLADKIDASVYPAPPIGNLQESSKPKRMKPEVFAVQDVNAQFGYQYLAGQKIGGDAINQLAMAPLVVEEERPEKKTNSGGSRGGLGGGSGSGAGGMSGSGSMQDGSGAGSGSGAGGMDGSGGMGAGGNKSAGPTYPTKSVPSYLLAEMEGVPVGGIENGGVVQRQMVSVTGLIPFKKQFEAYEKALVGTRKYSPDIDYPKYIGLIVYRRINGGDWVDVSDAVKQANELVTPVLVPNLIEADKYDPFINAPIPSILITNFDDFVTHPKLKVRDFLVGMDAEKDDGGESSDEGSSGFNNLNNFNGSGSSSGEEDENGDAKKVVKHPTSETSPEFKQVRFFDLLTGQSPKIKLGDKLEYKVSVVLSNPNLPMAFVKGEKRKMISGMGGMNSGREGPSSGGGGSGASAGDGESAGGNMTGDGRMTGGSGSGSGEEGDEDIRNKIAELKATIELEMLGNEAISDSDLAGSVRPEILKIKGLGPADLEDKDIVKKYGMIAPESGVSQPVTFVPLSDQFVSGSVEPLTIRRAQNVEFFDADPTAKMVVLVQDPKIALSVPGKTDVSAGSPLVFSSQAEIFNPLDSTIRIIGDAQVGEDGKPIDGKFTDYLFNSPGIVLDVTPTRAIKAVNSKDEYVTPGEVLVFDGSGRFSLRNELDDVGDFNRLTYVESDTPKPTKKKSGMSGFGDGGPGGNRGGLGGGGGGTPGN